MRLMCKFAVAAALVAMALPAYADEGGLEQTARQAGRVAGAVLGGALEGSLGEVITIQVSTVETLSLLQDQGSKNVQAGQAVITGSDPASIVQIHVGEEVRLVQRDGTGNKQAAQYVELHGPGKVVQSLHAGIATLSQSGGNGNLQALQVVHRVN